MRIAWVHSFKPGHPDSGIFMHRLAQCLNEKGIDVERIYTGRLTDPISLLATIRRLKILTREFDIIHAQYGSGCGYVGSFLKGPKILTLRGSDWYGGSWCGFQRGSLLWFLRSRLAMSLTRLAMKNYDTVITVSKRMRDEIQSNYRDIHLEVLPSGIDNAMFQPMTREEARSRIGESNDRSPWVLFSQPSKRLKRAYLANMAVEYARRQIPDLKIKLLEGCRPAEVPLWINASNVILITSTHEGWPNIVKEGLACNIPFVSTDVGDLHLIAEDTRFCTVTDATPAKLASGILKAIDQGETDSLRQYVAEFDLSIIGDRLVRLYEEVIARRSDSAL